MFLSGLSDWKKASEKFFTHENSECHKSSVAALMTFKQTSITVQLSGQVNKQMLNAQKLLLALYLLLSI